MGLSGKNHQKILGTIIFILLVLNSMALATSRPMKGRKIDQSVKTVVFVAGPVPPSAASSCTHIGNNGGAPCHGPWLAVQPNNIMVFPLFLKLIFDSNWPFWLFKISFLSDYVIEIGCFSRLWIVIKSTVFIFVNKKPFFLVKYYFLLLILGKKCSSNILSVCCKSL